MAPLAFPKPVRDVVVQPLMHDTPDELAQPEVLDWAEGECEPVPGKTMPHLRVVERDYANIYNKFISFGPKAREDGIFCERRAHPYQDAVRPDARESRHADARPEAYALRGVGWQALSEPRGRAGRVQHAAVDVAPETNGEAC